MVICDQLGLVFIEIPNTGCTAIRETLLEHYEGEAVLHKHATYYEYRRYQAKRYKDFFVFGTVRSPLETICTQYRKLVYDHRERFSRADKRSSWSVTKTHKQMFADVQGGLNFEQFLRKYFRHEYHNFYLTGSKNFDYVIRHEALQQGFDEVMRSVGVGDPVEIPKINQTEGKKNVEDEYAPEVRPHAINIFGPFMKQWGYQFPEQWGVVMPKMSFQYRYRVLEGLAEIAGKRLGLSPNGSPKVVQSLRELVRPLIG